MEVVANLQRLSGFIVSKPLRSGGENQEFYCRGNQTSEFFLPADFSVCSQKLRRDVRLESETVKWEAAETFMQQLHFRLTFSGGGVSREERKPLQRSPSRWTLLGFVGFRRVQTPLLFYQELVLFTIRPTDLEGSPRRQNNADHETVNTLLN